jgi:hypothetical protein
MRLKFASVLLLLTCDLPFSSAPHIDPIVVVFTRSLLKVPRWQFTFGCSCAGQRSGDRTIESQARWPACSGPIRADCSRWSFPPACCTANGNWHDCSRALMGNFRTFIYNERPYATSFCPATFCKPSSRSAWSAPALRFAGAFLRGRSRKRREDPFGTSSFRTKRQRLPHFKRCARFVG